MRLFIKNPVGAGLVTVFTMGLFTSPAVVQAESAYATPERRAVAVGHYARARALLVEALAEFEAGRQVARPDVLIDSDEWRLSVVSRTEELNRLLDPQPRVTRSGARFQASKSLIGRARDRLPQGDAAPQDSNTYGEEQRAQEISAARAMKSAEVTPLPTPPAPAASESTTAASESFHGVISKSAETVKSEPTATEELPSAAALKQKPAELDIVETSPAQPVVVEKTVEPVIVVEEPSAPAAEVAAKAEKPAADTSGATQEDLEISQAIEQAIKARLEKMNSDEPKPAASDAAPTAQ